MNCVNMHLVRENRYFTFGWVDYCLNIDLQINNSSSVPITRMLGAIVITSIIGPTSEFLSTSHYPYNSNPVKINIGSGFLVLPLLQL